ncbi:hypothetical protein PR003_g947 [Phytophthora rubi]|uniref:Uncharacterized protein n=1 Tax=Phytophthora rubi TaxID=129364 RepID=A0A6A4G6B4_9STRA|nr:hypothetical protein PR003_g947 [Phytophthora rubi]
MERRHRMDVVHDRLGLPRLDSAPYDIAIFEDDLQAEAVRLRDVAGLTGTVMPGLPREVEPAVGRAETDRAPLTTQGRVEFAVLQRILNSIEMEPKLLADRAKLRHLRKENTSAVVEWRRQTSAGFNRPPANSGGGTTLLDMIP